MTGSDDAGLAWAKSSLCSSRNCAEVAGLPGGGAAVRDSKNPDGPVLRFTPGEWKAFLAGARDGEFDDLASG